MRITQMGSPLLGLALAGCTAIAPESRTGELGLDVPGSWGASKEAEAGVDDAWVDRFKDRQLSALVDEAMENNRDLRAAATRVGIALANVRIAGAGARPSADLGLAGNRQKQNFIGFPFGGDPMAPGAEETVSSSLSNTFGLSFDVRWELDVWGRIRAGQSAAVAEAQASEAEFRSAQVSLAAQVAKAYFALAESKAQVGVARRSLSTFRETETVIRERFELGQNEEGSLGADLRLARSDVAQAEAVVAQREEERERAVRQLEVLLGRYPSGGAVEGARLPATPKWPPSGLPSELLQRRPDVLAAERRFAARGARVKEAKRAFFPQISLTGSTGTSTEELGEILNSDFGVWSLAGNVVQPILTGGQLLAQLGVREEEERQALAELQQAVLVAFSEVETALSVDVYLARREEALARAAALAKEADSRARSDYREAVGDFLTVLSAQDRVLTLESSLLTVRRLRLDNRVNLHLALGGDFRPRRQPNSSPAPLDPE